MNLDQAILRQVAQGDIEDQSLLLDRLQGEGFDLTLSTLSRHLKKLRIRKEAGVYRRRDPARTGIAPYTLCKVPPCLLVLRTASGFAQAMAVALDKADLPSLAGTIAGDDTIFAAPLEGSRLDDLESEIRQLFIAES